MWCYSHSFSLWKSITQTIKGDARSKKKQTEAQSDEKLGQFSYSIVPIRPLRHGFRRSLGKRYSSFQTPRRFIRLLRILPTRSDGLLECHIRAVKLGGVHAPEYDALSYTWGPTTREETRDGMSNEKNRTIVCNNKQLLVTENLFNCLTQLEEDGHYDRDLWIDAICVNQNDKAELNHQVSIMADIYRSADRVIVWLGAADEFTELAWELINSLRQLSEEDLLTIHPQAFESKRNAELIGHANSLEHWRALASLFGRTWFTRAWVVQELVLAKSTSVYCGSFDFVWDDMVSISHFLATKISANTFKAQIFDSLDGSSLSYKNPTKLAEIKKSHRDGTRDVLLYSLIRCRTYEASNDHDKVYSLLGLVNRQGQDYPACLYPDYSSDVATLYTNVAKYIIESSDNLHILAHAEGDRFRHVTGLPTWVPDWSVKKDLGLRITGYARYEAAGTLECFKEIRDGDVLALQGFELDTVSRIGETKEEVNQSKDCADWLDLRRELEEEYPERDFGDAFWRTLLIDTDPSSKVPITRPWENAFDVWMNLCANEPSEEEKQRATAFETSFTHSLSLRLFRTANGHLGCGTSSCREGDLIWIVKGSRVPLILRPTQRKNLQTYNLVGGTYLHGFMQGEALEGKHEFREVVLV